MQVPRVDKIVLNMGVGEAVADRKKVEQAAADLALIAGQKPVITKSRKSIATYKLREDRPIGCKVTLRKARMYEFLDRLVNIALPRVRDFRGLNPKSFDGRGNYALGIKEHIIFPEIDYDKVEQIWGMDIIVCTTAKTDDEARALLDGIQFPVPAVRRLTASSNADSQETEMAKKSSIEKNNRRAQAGEAVSRPRARALKAIARTRPSRWKSASRRTLKLAELPRNSSPNAHPQPLRDHRPAARAIIASSRCRASRCASSAPRA